MKKEITLADLESGPCRKGELTEITSIHTTAVIIDWDQDPIGDWLSIDPLMDLLMEHFGLTKDNEISLKMAASKGRIVIELDGEG